MTDTIAENIHRVQDRIASAAVRSGRRTEEVALLAVTKRVSPDRILEAVETGVESFGENYIQEALGKLGSPELKERSLAWHFIGHLQKNKAREAAGNFALIQSVDSLPLAQAIGKRAVTLGITADILLEVKLDDSETKFGIAPHETADLVVQTMEIPGIQLCGLMGMPPYSTESEATRPYFRTLKRLFDNLPVANRHTLSMGMSGDFETAIEEGSTLVRIGTAIFGQRQ